MADWLTSSTTCTRAEGEYHESEFHKMFGRCLIERALNHLDPVNRNSLDAVPLRTLTYYFSGVDFISRFHHKRVFL